MATPHHQLLTLSSLPPAHTGQPHFAAKVYKELFRSAGSAVLVDPSGGEWLCLVQTEARNDNRPQYTLRVSLADMLVTSGLAAKLAS